MARPHLPCFPILVLVFLVVHVHVPASHAGSLPETYDGSMCSESSMCGSVEIKYPFYFADETKRTTDNSTNYSCGYTDLMIFCRDGDGDANTTIIQLDQHNYTVKDINYSTSTIHLVDDEAFGNDGCAIDLHNISLDNNWLQYKQDSSYGDLTFFLGCYSGKPFPDGFKEYKIDCPGFRSPLGYGFSLVLSSVEQFEEPHVAQDLKENCGQVIVMPVLINSLYRPSKPNPRKEYSGMLKQGFELEWYPMITDPCYPCQESGGRCAYGDNKAFLGCLCAGEKGAATNCNNSGASSAPSTQTRHPKRTKIYIIASITSTLLLCPIFLAVYLTCKHGCPLLPKTKDAPNIETFLKKNGTIHPRRYTYAEVKRMTKSFSVKLGQGGFGMVYKGNLPNGHEVAVKMLKETNGNGEEFINEVASISKTSHVNVVSLLGFCLQGPKRALLYDYMPNGSLERYAFNNNLSRENTLTWEKLFDIAIGIARGLEYLHRGCNTRIIHFDIKPHNILLDQDFCPKISDFGLAKLCLNKESAISIVGARGTIGYIAPEVYSKQFGIVSSKSDVYSYGMMVLEMVGARDKKIGVNSESSSQYFPQWIYEHIDDYCISASELNGETTELVRKMIVVGLWCIQVTPTHRPTMTRVVEMLEGSTSTLELPPKTLLS